MPLSAGQMVTRALRLVRPIGKGGMGEVWEAYHQTLGSNVAIKFVDAAVVKGNPAVLERFNREAGIAAKLKNPHVARTYDHGMLPDGTPYIVMDLLEGESLHQRLRRTGPLTLEETSLVLGQSAQALRKAHKLGIVHRDVKPGNLFCVEDTGYDIFIKLLDFGIAKHAKGMADVGLTSTGGMLGSPLYMSPEQFNSAKGVDHRGDLWSLAAVAYCCLAGRPPFYGEALAQVIMAVMSRDFPPITSVRDGLPATMDGWFDKAFHQDIAQRHQSAQELARSFAAATRGEKATPGMRAPLPSITDMSRQALPPSDAAGSVPGANSVGFGTAGRGAAVGAAADVEDAASARATAQIAVAAAAASSRASGSAAVPAPASGAVDQTTELPGPGQWGMTPPSAPAAAAKATEKLSVQVAINPAPKSTLPLPLSSTPQPSARPGPKLTLPLPLSSTPHPPSSPSQPSSASPLGPSQSSPSPFGPSPSSSQRVSGGIGAAALSEAQLATLSPAAHTVDDEPRKRRTRFIGVLVAAAVVLLATGLSVSFFSGGEGEQADNASDGESWPAASAAATPDEEAVGEDDMPAKQDEPGVPSDDGGDAAAEASGEPSATASGELPAPSAEPSTEPSAAPTAPSPQPLVTKPSWKRPSAPPPPRGKGGFGI